MLSVGDLSTTLASQPGPELGFTVRLGSTLKEVESELIARTISFAGGNKSRAAQILGVGRRTLYKQPDRYKAYETNGHSNGRPPRNGRNGIT
jgi:DNA-binding NtrC family response regulator